MRRNLTLDKFSEMIPKILEANGALGYETNDSCPIWALLYLLAPDSAGKNANVRITYVPGGYVHISIARQDETPNAFTFVSSVLPLTNDPAELFAFLADSRAPCTVHSVPHCLVPHAEANARLNVERQVIPEYVYPTRGLLALNEPSSVLSKSMRNKRRACLNIASNPAYEILDIFDAEHEPLFNLLDDWWEEHNRDDLDDDIRNVFTLELLRRVRDSGLRVTGSVVRIRNSNHYMGATVAAEVSGGTWTMLGSIQRRSVPCLSDFMWRHEAYKWTDHPIEVDGGTVGPKDDGVDGLAKHKMSYVKAAGGHLVQLYTTTRIPKRFSNDTFTIGTRE